MVSVGSSNREIKKKLCWEIEAPLGY